MSGRFVVVEEGQALVIAALAMVVLMGALALTIDWGYGFAERRAAQNEADAGVLAASRLLATTFVSATQPFDQTQATQEKVWATACAAATKNVPAGPATKSQTLAVWFSADPPTTPFSTGTTSTWRGIRAPSDNCTIVPAGATAVDGNTVFVRVVSSAWYTSLFGIPTRQRIDVAAAARVRLIGAGSSRGPGVVPLAPVGNSSVGAPGLGLSGSSTAPNVAIWPIVIHYRAQDWANTGSQVILLDWGSGADTTNPNFFVSFAHFSPSEARDLQVHQLITESDYTGIDLTSGFGFYGQPHGHPQTGKLPSAAGTCGVPLWDTRGSPDFNTAATCDIPNWFNYGYRGSLSVDTSWDDLSWRSFEITPQPLEVPDPFPGIRASCAGASGYPFFTAPSCPDTARSSLIGDWVETVRTGVDRALVATQMTAFIGRYGRIVPATGDTAVVVNVFLWDCGEHFDASAPIDPPRNRWRSVINGADCSTISGSALTSVDRVHLFTVVPVTVSLRDIDLTQRRVTAHWGHAFGAAGDCAWVPTSRRCALNPLINSAFLVPDE